MMPAAHAAGLDRVFSLEALTALARRRLPRAVFDFYAGGAEDEVTLRANRAAFGRLALLPKGSCFVNVSRGAIVDQHALTAALASGQISEATLDVFDREPLPPEDPLWALDNVLITPHLASVAIPATAAQQVADNIQRLNRGEPVLNQVDPARGY